MINDSDAMRVEKPRRKKVVKHIFISNEAYSDASNIDTYIREKKKDCDTLIVEIGEEPSRQVVAYE